MPLVLVATAKSATANVYDTLANADTYFEGRLAVTAWDAASDDDKNRALRMATDELDKAVFTGTRTTAAQRLQWPRYDTYDHDGWVYDSDVNPRPIKEAMFELALSLTDGTYSVTPDALAQFENVKVGSLDVTPRGSYRPAKWPDSVRDIIAHLLANYSEYAVRTVHS